MAMMDLGQEIPYIPCSPVSPPNSLFSSINNFPAEGDTPTIHKDENGDSYINIGGTVIPSDYMSPGCLVTIYGPSDQLLGEWCTDQSLRPIDFPTTMRAFSVRAYVSNATINLTGETTLTTHLRHYK